MNDADKLMWEKRQVAWLMKRVTVGIAIATCVGWLIVQALAPKSLREFWRVNKGMNMSEVIEAFPYAFYIEPNPESLPDFRHQFPDLKSARPASGTLYIAAGYEPSAARASKLEWLPVTLKKGVLTFEDVSETAMIRLNGRPLSHDLPQVIKDAKEVPIKFFPLAPPPEMIHPAAVELADFTGSLLTTCIESDLTQVAYTIKVVHGRVAKTEWVITDF